MLNLVGEVGWQFGKDLNLSTTFENNDPKDNRLFGSGGAAVHLLVEPEPGFEAGRRRASLLFRPVSPLIAADLPQCESIRCNGSGSNCLEWVGRVAPNPLVGAVVLQGDELVGEGFHAEFGERHAEVAALEAAGSRATGGTVLVTLEPCNHQGKQPPCTGALIVPACAKLSQRSPIPTRSGRWRSSTDRPRHQGRNRACAEEASRQNAAFLHQFTGTERPFVALKLATTLDGKIADHAGRSRWISGPRPEFVHRLRAGYDAIGVGGYTARTDDASLTARGSVEPRIPPKRVVFDRLGDLPASLTLVKTAREIPTLLFTTPQASPAKVDALESAGVEVHQSASLTAALGLLGRQGVQSMLVEGGGRMAGALLAEGLVDRYYWIQSPVWLGDGGIPAVEGFPGSRLMEAERWQVVERRALGEDTLLVGDRAGCLPES
jgi:diaminohydroxyphosphoribosylaminopyrimidine deaminase/5-amino-6-(5-phosphoribosylamino)uracil reductase